jgi:hypothetical protein
MAGSGGRWACTVREDNKIAENLQLCLRQVPDSQIFEVTVIIQLSLSFAADAHIDF